MGNFCLTFSDSFLYLTVTNYHPIPYLCSIYQDIMAQKTREKAIVTESLHRYNRIEYICWPQRRWDGRFGAKVSVFEEERKKEHNVR
uniref:Uncharacterized protein n=1 Tax=Rhizophora mucronata TaxID=61149 RepID=A0A2P2INL8_RHIMU